MSNRTFLNDEKIVEIVLEGKQTAEATFAIIQESMIYTQHLSSLGEDIKILIDARGVTNIDEGGAQKAAEADANVAFDKLAIYGASPENKAKMSETINLGGANEKAKVFDTREQAIAWLNS